MQYVCLSGWREMNQGVWAENSRKQILLWGLQVGLSSADTFIPGSEIQQHWEPNTKSDALLPVLRPVRVPFPCCPHGGHFHSIKICDLPNLLSPDPT